MKKLLLLLLSLFILASCAPQVKKTDEGSVFYPPLPQKPRLQYLTTITSEEDIGKKQSQFQEFLLGEIPPLKKIDRPFDIGSVKDRIYISDRTHRKIIYIDLKEKLFNFIDDKRGGSLGDPLGMYVTKDGFKYVADSKRKQIVVFDSNDNYVKTYGSKETLNKPIDVALYENKLYVADFNKHQIVVFDKESGDVLQIIGEEGEDEGTFYKPSHVMVDSNGHLLVNDSFNFRIQRFSPEGEFMNVIGYHGDTLGGFSRPKGIAIADNHLYAVDTAFENVQIFDVNSGDVLLFFGGFGEGVRPGSMWLPSGIAIDHENINYFSEFADRDFKIKYLIYVGNMLGYNKLNVYGFGEWIGETLPEMEK